MRTAPNPGTPAGHATGTLVLLMVLCTVTFAPQGLIWCQGADGHSGLEYAWLGCGLATGLECCGPAARVEPQPTPYEARLMDGRCTDVQVETVASSSSAPRLVAPKEACGPHALPGTGPEFASGLPTLAPPAPTQVAALLRSTILTI
jgi:hypothetical protein